jgi:hypothetical protein
LKNNRSPVVFVGNARDYHTMDWCRAVRLFLPPESWVFLTDCIESEGHIRIVTPQDRVQMLLSIDHWLLSEQSGKANSWRNLVKFLHLPLQSIMLRLRLCGHHGRVIHAHTFYYGMVCRLAMLPYLFTPQGGELTERPRVSSLYRRLMRWTLAGARFTFVDSERMRQSAIDLGCLSVAIYQYGIDTATCLGTDKGHPRWRLLSNRGIEVNYRIEAIQKARNLECPDLSLTFFYPLWNIHYQQSFRERLESHDEDMGRISKNRCYELYAEARLVISIPVSDSSPRSVYEAIFCGAPIVTTASRWVDDLPGSMRCRVLLIDPDRAGWLEQALAWADDCLLTPFRPCDDALARYDQFEVARNIYERFYRPILVR